MNAVSVRTWSQEREWETSYGLEVFISPSPLPCMMNFAHGFGFASEFFPCDK